MFAVEQINTQFNPPIATLLFYFCFCKKLKKRAPSKLLTYQASLVLEPHAHHFNMWRNPKLDRPALPCYSCWALIRQSLFRSGVSRRVSWYNYLTACWPAPAALHTNSRIFTGTPWLRNSEDSVPDDGNLWPSGPVEYGDDGRLWWYPGRGGRTQEKVRKGEWAQSGKRN